MVFTSSVELFFCLGLLIINLLWAGQEIREDVPLEFYKSVCNGPDRGSCLSGCALKPQAVAVEINIDAWKMSRVNAFIHEAKLKLSRCTKAPEATTPLGLGLCTSVRSLHVCYHQALVA